jgi:hypothetical protein
VNRFTTVELSHLNSRIASLKRAEQDLSTRVANRMAEVENEGRWLESDPMYQSLSSALGSVRRDLRDAEHELLREAGERLSPSAVGSIVEARHTRGLASFGFAFLQLVRRWKQHFASKTSYQA